MKLQQFKDQITKPRLKGTLQQKGISIQYHFSPPHTKLHVTRQSIFTDLTQFELPKLRRGVILRIHFPRKKCDLRGGKSGMLRQTETRVAEHWLSNTVLGDKNTCDIFQDLIQKKTEWGKIREPQQQPAKQSKPASVKGRAQKMATHIQKVCNTKAALTCLDLCCIQVRTRDNSR